VSHGRRESPTCFHSVIEKIFCERSAIMPGNIFYIIGVIVVVLFILGYLGLR
jgi:hypothetical protein